MSVLNKFVKDTGIYGLATVLPRLMNFLLVPLHTTELATSGYSDNTTFYIYAAFLNVLLSFGMETAFFRFFTHASEKNKVYSTTFISITSFTILFLVGIVAFNESLASLVNLNQKYFNLLIGVVLLDALVVAPFAYLRATGKTKTFSIIKLSNVATYVLLNYFFLWFIPTFKIGTSFYDPTDLVQYIFISNLAASVVTFLFLTPYFFKVKMSFDLQIFKNLMSYGWPVMVAGLAYVINENFDKWLLPELLGKDINGAYAGCYKIAVFMTIFIQAFRIGAEPFFFSHSKSENPQQTYATIMKYFVVFGSVLMVFVVSYLDIITSLVVPNETYWVAIGIVPIILLANLFLGIYFNLALWYKLTDRTRIGMYISILGAVITIGLNYMLIPKIGFMGSAWTTLIAYGVMMIVSYLLGRKHYPVPYNLVRIGLYLLLASGLSYVAMENRGNYYLTTGLVFIFLIIIGLLERKELQQILKR
ncbi:MAG: polysaccharide biosynthesis protein [Bacteroidetes bacterium MedPE-SWsnd-G2]|nr:MAG: polysaccharide biosynthesis protein [Bacteroidetes bacterium MedPE-SWsnd-G2]